MEKIPSSKAVMEEALILSEEILRNIELSEITLANIALRVLRLARILNDFPMTEVLELEIGGYTLTEDNKIPSDEFEISIIAGRDVYGNGKTSYTDSIGDLEQECKIGEISIQAAKDPNISSANPYQRVGASQGNWRERGNIRKSIKKAQKRLQSRRKYLYLYTLNRNSQLKFTNTAEDIFTRLREHIDKNIDLILSGSKNRFISIYDNINSQNSEDWRLAVQSCRMLIKDLADQIYPPRDPFNDGKKDIILDEDHYISRIGAFIRENSHSKSFKRIFNANADLLESLLKRTHDSTSKGSHKDLYDRDEADRIVLQTYIIIGDILKIYMDSQEK